MANAAKNYMKMHHPSVYKKMYGGGKVKKMYQKGGKVKGSAKNFIDKTAILGNAGEGDVLKDVGLQEGLVPYIMNPTQRGKYDITDIVKNREESAKRGLEKRKKMVVKELKEEKLGGYANGGQVKKAQALQGMGDVVDAKLTPGEIVLNADQQSALEQELGQPIDGLMSKIGVPGFEEGGKVEKKYTPIGDPSKLTWNYHKMSDVQKDSLVTAQEKHYESLGHSKTGIIKAYDNIKTNTPEMNEMVA